MPGSKCPYCEKSTYYVQGPVSQCSKCGTTGWGWNREVKKGKSGKGFTCPNCDKQTLHQVANVGNSHAVRRCATCDYSLVVPFTPA